MTLGRSVWHDRIHTGFQTSADLSVYPPSSQTAILYEADEPGQHVEVTYAELLREVSKVANVLKSWGVKKGDVVRSSVNALSSLARLG